MVGWHHQLDVHEFEQAPGVGGERGSLVCFSLWGCNMTEQLNWLTTCSTKKSTISSFSFFTIFKLHFLFPFFVLRSTILYSFLLPHVWLLVFCRFFIVWVILTTPTTHVRGSLPQVIRITVQEQDPTSCTQKAPSHSFATISLLLLN